MAAASPESPAQPSEPTLLAEYAASQAAYLHYDAFRWQSGSFLIAGVFIFWGLLSQQHTPQDVAVVGSLLVTALISTWVLFAHHYRQIYLCKLHRIHELEAQLGMRQHLRFKTREYEARGPRGHVLDIVVFLTVVVGTPAIATARTEFSWWFVLPVILGLAVALYVLRNEQLGPKLPQSERS